ncbi:hypothetical protein QW131_07130 [Roseibium salinum]|nr:hypothetical protein [Roseibium salinum]
MESWISPAVAEKDNHHPGQRRQVDLHGQRTDRGNRDQDRNGRLFFWMPVDCECPAVMPLGGTFGLFKKTPDTGVVVPKVPALRDPAVKKRQSADISSFSRMTFQHDSSSLAAIYKSDLEAKKCMFVA